MKTSRLFSFSGVNIFSDCVVTQPPSGISRNVAVLYKSVLSSLLVRTFQINLIRLLNLWSNETITIKMKLDFLYKLNVLFNFNKESEQQVPEPGSLSETS